MRRRSLGMAVAAVAATVAFAAPQLASSAPRQDPRAEREQVRAEKAQLAAEIDTSKASLSEVDDALQVLEDNLETQQAALARTEEEVAQAENEIADAEQAIDGLTEQIGILEDEMRRRAVDAYVSPPSEDILSVLGSEDFTSAASRRFYVELRAQDDADIADRLDGAGTDLAYQKRLAKEAKVRAEQKRAEQAERTAAVADAEAKQQQLADDMQATIDAQIDRSLELAATDRKLSAQIAQEQAALLARLAAQKAKEDQAAAARAARDAARASNANAAGRESAPSGGGGGGGASVEPGGFDSGIELAEVQGIPVNAKVAQQVSDMINAAAADGVNLRIGNSYRSVARQIELRRQNCGSSYYAIYEMSSGSCSPPTAKPGQSQHQLGLAIDFANCGRSSACFQWLRGNASRFGYYNLPSESWHWSTTGT